MSAGGGWGEGAHRCSPSTKCAILCSVGSSRQSTPRAAVSPVALQLYPARLGELNGRCHRIGTHKGCIGCEDLRGTTPAIRAGVSHLCAALLTDVFWGRLGPKTIQCLTGECLTDCQSCPLFRNLIEWMCAAIGLCGTRVRCSCARSRTDEL